MDPGVFSGLPLEQQLEHLRTSLAKQDPWDLLELVATVRDTALLSYLADLLAQNDFFAEHSQAFGDYLLRLDETQVVALLRRPDVGQAALWAMQQAPLERLGTFCILDRYLKHHHPRLRDDHLHRWVEELKAKLQKGQVPPAEGLVPLVARALPTLVKAAEQGGCGDEFREKREELARLTVDVCARAPKGVSQANAEELLSRRVYTDPGHFLIELLQNADDAEAKNFEVSFDTEAIRVWHDGLPFDVRDLVGVTSIGQTTKRKQQIGFFGVGFKSVYEVTARPQIYSDVYRFEIADISIPRFLAGRPQQVQSQGTTLVLPLRPQARELLETLFKKALALDPCMLLTLRELRAIRFSLEMPGQETRRRQMERHDDPDRIVLNVDGRTESFLLAERELRFPGARELGRPDRTTLKVGVRLDREGQPLSLPPRAATVYSYLPTAEHTGLRFFVQGHFDVPVDRERLAGESEWNRFLLQSVPALLAELAQQLGRGILPVLPVARELKSPLFTFVPEALREALVEVACLPAHDGSVQPPSRLRLCPPDWLELFDEEPVGEHLFLAGDDERLRELAGELGCSPFTLDDLLDCLVAGSWRPAAWGPLFSLLQQELQLQLRQGTAAKLESRLRREPLLPDQHGQLRRSSELVMVKPPLRELYEHRSLLNEQLHPFEILLLSTGIAEITPEVLVRELQRDPGPLLEHEEILARVLGQLPPPTVRPLADLALFPYREKRLALALHPTQRQRLWLAEEGTEEFFAGLPLLESQSCWREFAENLHAQRFDLNAAIGRLNDELSLTTEQLDAFLKLLTARSETLNGRSLDLLPRLPLFEAEQGKRLPLLVLADPRAPQELREILTMQPFLRPGSVSAKAVEALALQHRLLPADPGLLVDHLPALESRELQWRALDYLSGEWSSLTRDQITRCLTAPLFPDRPLGVLRQQPDPGRSYACEAGLEPAFAALGITPLDEGLSERFAPLLRAAHWPILGLDELVRRLMDSPPNRDSLPEVQRVIEDRFQELIDRYPLNLRRALRVFEDRAGRVVGCELLLQDEAVAERLGLQEYLPKEPLSRRLRQVFPLPKAHRFVSDLLVKEARFGQPLSNQKAWLSKLENIVELHRRVHLDTTLLVDNRGKLRDDELDRAPPEVAPLLTDQELVHPHWPEDLARLCRPVHPNRILDAYLEQCNDEFKRQLFYSWLIDKQAVLFTNDETRGRLRREPLFRTAWGNWIAAERMVTDPDFPDLDLDWRPHQEIPRECLEVLERHLGIGRPDPQRLVQEHLLPAYRARLKAGEEKPVLTYLANLCQNFSESDLKLLLLPFEARDQHGQVRPLEELVVPGAEGLLDKLPRPAVAENLEGFWRRLGLTPIPRWQELKPLVYKLSLSQQTELLQALAHFRRLDHGRCQPLLQALSQHAWLWDRSGRVRRPCDLVSPVAGLESLVGTSPQLFAQAEVPDELLAPLGFRGEDQVRLDEVLDHLQHSVRQNYPVSQRVYRFLETQLSNGSCHPSFLVRELGQQPWIWTEEGRYFTADQVLCVPAFRFFGEYRGFWEGASRRYPRLCTAFEVPQEVTPALIIGFLEQVERNRLTLEKDPSLARLLQNCLAWLGEQGRPIPRQLKVVLARRARDQRRVLVAAGEPGLVQSDTPSLERLFAGLDRLYLAEPAGSREAAGLEAFFRVMGIPRLREAYQVRSDDSSGREVTAEMAPQVQSLRSRIRGLMAVLPRVRKQRAFLDDGNWLAQSRLAPLASTGPIRAIEGLRIVYSLPQVGEVKAEVPAAYNPARSELLVSRATLEHPEQGLTGLAQALVTCIYDGPGDEQLTDLVEILLLRGDERAMHSYLDRRHFPRVDGHEMGPEQALAERVGEMLDFRFDRKLEQRYPELEGADFERWRDPEFLAAAASHPQPARRFLHELGVEEPDPELVEVLDELLTSEHLKNLPGPSSESYAVTPVAPPPPAPSPTPRVSEPSTVPAEAGSGGGPGLFQRFSQWLKGSPEQPDNLMKPGDRVGFQPHQGPPNYEEMYEDPPQNSFFFEAPSLSAAHLYAVHTVGGRFSSREQSWLPLTLRQTQTEVSTGKKIHFRGRIFPGTTQLPVPMFSRPDGKPRLKGEARSVVLRGPDGLGRWQLVLDGDEPLTVSYSVELMRPATPLAADTEAPAELRRPTESLRDLPRPLQEKILEYKHSARPVWRVGTELRDWVAENYRYDQEYRKLPAVQKAVSSLPRGRGNHQLRLTHAGADAQHLGSGACSELAAVLVELLRHLDIPTVLCTCWAFDRGVVHAPDHAIALMGVAVADGICWLPLDPAFSQLGGSAPLEDGMRRACALLGLRRDGDAQTLRERLLQHLRPDQLEMLLSCLRGEQAQVPQLSPLHRELEEKGLVQISEVKGYRIQAR